MRCAIVAAAALAGCSSFDLELDVSRLSAPEAEVRIDGRAVGDVYRATFDDYDDAKRARPVVEVWWEGGVVDGWDGAVLGCQDACDRGGCPASELISAKLDVIVQPDYTIARSYEGQCVFDSGTTLSFAP